MLNKQQVTSALEQFEKDYQIPKNKILIIAGSAMVMRGLRDECSDIDMGIPTEEVLRLQTLEGFTKAVPRFAGFLRLEKGDYDLGNNTYPSEPMDGYMVQTLESLLVMKLRMNREKDQADIVKLEEALSVV